MVPMVPPEVYDPVKKREKKMLEIKSQMRPEMPI
jgi:hypothetical protein